MLEKFAFLAKGHKSGSLSPTSQKTSPASSSVPRLFPVIWSPASTKSEGSTSPESMSSNEAIGVGILPRVDAPASAINGGDRRVAVRCVSSTVPITVKPETSPVDIVYATSELVTHDINPSTSIVVECYGVLGLERRLRKYERVRDAMNSWDRDEQNHLLIMPHDRNRNDGDLELSSVPRTSQPPTGFTMELRHSSRPGKWKKCFVTLMDNGQMFAAKRSDSKHTDKDSTNLCHLSDFDIYTPKETGVSRHFKAPKKFAYAVKSQQKINVFPNGENFVHFFCTDDSKTAHKFHEMVHGWRSWYLANKQIDLLRKDEVSQPSRESDEILTDRLSENLVPFISEKLPGSMKLRVSERLPERLHGNLFDKPKPTNIMGGSNYSLGNFEPLVVFDKPVAADTKKKSAETKGATLIDQITSKKQDEFLSGGLLGDGYTQRKRADTVATTKPDGPFTEGSSLLNDNTPAKDNNEQQESRKSWFPSAQEHSARVRSQSLSQATRRPITADASRKGPMLNFGQHFPPSRNTQRPGTSHGPGNGLYGGPTGHAFKPPPGGGPLVDHATDSRPPIRGPSHQRTTSSISLSSKNIPFGRQRSRSVAASTSGPPEFDFGHHPLPKDVPMPPFAPRSDDILPIPQVPERSSRRPDSHMRTGSDPRIGHVRSGSDFRMGPDGRKPPLSHMRTGSYGGGLEEMRGRAPRLRPSQEQLKLEQQQHQLRAKASREQMWPRASQDPLLQRVR